MILGVTSRDEISMYSNLRRMPAKANQVSDLNIDSVRTYILYDDTCPITMHVFYVKGYEMMRYYKRLSLL